MLSSMNRLDRLYALAEELRARAPRPITARELGERFEVSTRTIERDLLALQEAGVPIRSQTGPGGGYAVDPLTSLPPLNLTPAEATAIATALAAGSGLPFAEAGRSAMRKLVAAMATAQRDEALALAGRVHFVAAPATAVSDADAPPDRRGGIPGGAAAPADSGTRRIVEEAVARGVAVQIEYADRAGDVTRRIVEPAGLLRGAHGWYLVGWCRLRNGGRAFRLDRLRSAALTQEPAPGRLVEELVHDIPYPLEPLSLHGLRAGQGGGR
jgi:predicted DNA-binding transcriptional regulator YafY